MPGKHDDGGDLYSGSDTDNFDAEPDQLNTTQLDQLFTAPPRGADPEERTAAATRRRQPPPLSTNQVRSSTHTHC